MTMLTKHFNVRDTNIVHNQGLFWNFDTLRDYCFYSLHIQDQNDYYPKKNSKKLVVYFAWKLILCRLGNFKLLSPTGVISGWVVGKFFYRSGIIF